MRLALSLLVLATCALAQPAPKRKRAPASKPAAADTLKISVFHTNDIHGWIMARPDEFLDPVRHRPIGGVGALGNYLKRQNGPRLLLDAGDWFQGTPEGDLQHGRVMAEVFNALQYDAVALGNHEFDFGAESLEQLVKRLKVPVLAANVYLKGQRRKPGWLTPFVLKDVAGVKVGLFGLLTPAMPKLAFPEHIKDLDFRRPIDEAKEAVKLLRGAGATVIVAVTHEGLEGPKDPIKFEGDQTLAREVPGIDLIVGGHTHTFLREAHRDPKNKTLVVQAGVNLAAVGHATLEIDPKTKRVVGASDELVDLWADSLGEDPDIMDVVAPYEKEADRVYGVVIATAAASLKRNRDGESALQDWVTDCVRGWAAADLAVQNGSGTRSDVREGPVTLRTIFDLMPFENHLATLMMKGADVADLLSQGVGWMAMLQESGATFRYDRRYDGKSSSAFDVKIGGAALEADKLYKVVTSDFLVEGGFAGSVFGRAASRETSSVLFRDVLAGCARKQGVIKAPEGGRMIPMEGSRGSQERAR